MAGLNKQPIFTAVIKTAPTCFDPPIPTTLCPIDNFQAVYTDASSFGALVTKVTVTAPALNTNIVTSKVIYLGVYDGNNGEAILYKSALMTGLTMTSTSLPPQVVFTFETGDTQGLLIKPSDRITISASDNFNNTGEAGDKVSVVVEVSTYDI